MNAARLSTAGPVDLFNIAGEKIGVIQNANPINDQIVDIGVTNLQHTQFNQTLNNLRKIDAATTAVTPVTSENINEALSVTGRSYGLSMEQVKIGEEHLVRQGMAFGKVAATTAADSYSDEVIRYALGYQDIDPLSRVTGVATSRATAQDFAKAINMANSSLADDFGALSEGRAGAEAVDQTAKRLRQIADIAPINFAVAQGQEGLFGYEYGVRGAKHLFQKNLYFRMTAGSDAPLKSSEKITMVAQDFMDLTIKIGEGRRVSVGSEEFMQSAANRFVQSFVHPPPTAAGFEVPPTINLIFNPQNLTQESYEDLANQVIGSQVRRFQISKTNEALAQSVKGDFNAITDRIFGLDYESTQAKLRTVRWRFFF